MIKKVAANVDFVTLEHEILNFWEKQAIFKKLLAKNANGPKWSFIDGPITANNPMGVHHAWGRTYKDIFHRYRAMRGFRTRYQNGFDCQGLWVEVEVEKEEGFKSKRDIEHYGIEKFVEKCKERVRKYSAIQTAQSIRLGYWMDWGNSYYTMSDENNYTIWHFLKKCHEKGWIYKGHDVMPWCIRCGAALSEHEIATEGYKELTHLGVTVKFPLLGRDKESLLVWTTTPWTLTSNTASAVHSAMTYSRARQGDEIFYIIAGRESEILKGAYTIEDKIAGQAMLGWQYRGPFDELPAQKGVQHIVIPWDEISAEEGTGIVHIAPGCGQEDHQLGKKYDLAVIAPLDEFGNYLEGFGWLTGRNVNEVTKDILKDLEQKGIKYRADAYKHRYPVCWRHGTELIFRLVDEWFISMDELRQPMMEVTRSIRWIPDYGLQHELDWLKNMHDWMISKKRYWGLALPIYECAQCGKVTVIGSKEELQTRAVEGWEQFEGHSPHRPWVDAVKIRCENCGALVSRIPDVGNPWLDAGIVPFSTLHYSTDRAYWAEWFPADFITESLPGQFRNWFYSLLAMSTVLENRAPFRTILGYALVKDERGQDMHKSAGNAIWFDEAAEKMGVDVMRWLYADHNPFNNLNFGYNVAQDFRKRLITLWNSYSFFATYAELDKFDPREHQVPYERLIELDRWLLARLHQLIQTADENYADYNVMRVMKAVDDFLEVLSNWYIRRSRRRFWKAEDDQDKWGAYSTLYQALKGLILVMAPVTPFVTEAIYQNLVRSLEPEAPESIHLCEFPRANTDLVDAALLKKIDTVILLVSMGRAARNKVNLKVRQPLSKIYIKLPQGEAPEKYADVSNQILEELNIKSLDFIISDGELVEYIIKPNFANLRDQYGPLLGQIQAALARLDANSTAQKLAGGGAIELDLNSQKIFLTSNELLVETREKEGKSVVTEGGYLVALDTELTEELIKEGTVRDFIRHIQTMRKEAGFLVEDRIKVCFSASPQFQDAVQSFLHYFQNETLANIVELKFAPGEFEKEINLEGEKVRVSLTRIN